MRTLPRGLLAYGPIVVIGAVVQALTVIGDPVPTMSWGFSARVLVSMSVSTLTVWLLMSLAVRPKARFSPRLLLAVTVAVLCGIVAGILDPILALLVALISLPVLSAAATGSVKAVIPTITFAPIRVFLGLIWAVLLMIVNVVAALFLGFFVTGPVAAGITWLLFGVSAAILTTHWASLHRRAHSS